MIELAQFETAISFILPAILDHVANQREPVRMGNASPDAVPHGVYPCKGEDNWCAIAVLDDEQWIRLCNVVDKQEWIEDQRFGSFMNRKSREAELNALLSNWTRKFSATEVMEKMQSAGVPAGVVKNAAEVYDDPQLRIRNLFWPMPHSEVGSFTHLGASFQLSKTPGKPYRASPGIGEHTEYICTKVLGLTDNEFIDLLQEGIFE